MNFIPTDPSAPMGAAPFVWRDDGRPDWRAMWTTFCALALHGGPPHRGRAQALRFAVAPAGSAGSDPAMVAEMRRGILETTGLFAEAPAPGWIAVTCESRAMARWLTRAIEREHVEARAQDDRVLLPAGPGYTLKDEVKSIVTVVAKTHHYWAAHVAAGTSVSDVDDAPRHAFRCVRCGAEFHVSRPEHEAERDATCPVDDATVVRLGIVRVRPNGAVSAVWHRHGPDEPYHTHEAGGEAARGTGS